MGACRAEHAHQQVGGRIGHFALLGKAGCAARENTHRQHLLHGVQRTFGLRNGGFCRLLALSEKAHNEYRFNGVSSWLDVKILQLRELSERNIGVEMDRRLPSADPALRTYIIDQVGAEPREPCCLLDDLLRYLESNECSKAAAKHFILDYRKKH